MGRQREFEPEQALEKAMQLFWKQGYFDTSIEELVSYTGVSRKGLYSTFGNKHQLYVKTLKYYQELFCKQMLEVLSPIDAALPEIKTFFNETYIMLQTPSGKFGCFICNAAHELAINDDEVNQCIQSHWQNLLQLMERALINAKHNGELPEDIEPRKYAHYLSGVLQGLANLVRGKRDIEIIKNYFDVALSPLEMTFPGEYNSIN